MSEENTNINYKMMNLFTLMNYKGNHEKIKKDENLLYKVTNDYLEVNGANPIFLNKPAVVERVKRIIFENLILADNTKFTKDGIIYEKGNNFSQKLGIDKNGNIIFYREKDNNKRVSYFDIFEDDIVCRYFEYNKNNTLRNEKRIIIDEFGFDKEYNDLFFDLDNKNREVFNHVITATNNVSLIAIADTGNYSITQNLDDFFISRGFKSKIEDDIYNPDIIEKISFKDVNKNPTSYLTNYTIKDEDLLLKIKQNYDYLKNKYPNVEKWFVDRFGKEFLKENKIIPENSEIEEKSIFEKIDDAKEGEILVRFKNIDLNYDEKKMYIDYLYNQKEYFKSLLFLKKMSDLELNRFVKEDEKYEEGLIMQAVSMVDDDKLKIELIDSFEDFEIKNKITAIESLKDENEKVKYYNKYLEDIIEYDNSVFDGENEEEDEKENTQEEMQDMVEKIGEVSLSQRVLDSLSEHDNLVRFIIPLKETSILKYNYIKDFSKDEIFELIEEVDDDLSLEDYTAILQTNKIDDDNIIEFLEDNWTENLNILKEFEEIELEDNIGYTFKVFALMKVDDDDKKVEFLEEHIDDYGADEITAVLKDLKDSDRILNLAKEFELPKNYYYDLVVLCSDDDKFKCLNEEENMEEEDLTTIISSIYDMPKAFEYVENNKNLNIIQKIRVLSNIEMDLYDEPDVMEQMKNNFLKKNKEEILKNIKTEDDMELLENFIMEYSSDFENAESVIRDFDEFEK